MNDERKTIPCETCGTPTPYFGTKRCECCWNTERHLARYLKSPGGQKVVRDLLPKLDDWVDGHPDAWNYDGVLAENEVTVEWCGDVVDGEGAKSPAGEFAGWSMAWKHGCMSIGQTTEVIARKAAAMFVSLWLRGVSASFADKLMDGYITFLERQEGESLTFLAEIDRYSNGRPFFRLTREGLMRRAHDSEWKIIEALDPQLDEEIIVTFTKRKRMANDGTPMCRSRCADRGLQDEGHVNEDSNIPPETP
jgi:hypothetical protein